MRLKIQKQSNPIESSTQVDQAMQVLSERYVLHVEENTESIAVGSDSTQEGARIKARSRVGVSYMYKYTTYILDNEESLSIEFVEATGRK